MQRIKFEAPTGAELRQQMLDFLGMSESPCSVKMDSTQLLTKIARQQVVENELPDFETKQDEIVAPETTTATRKRRTKAELEAEKAAEAQANTDATQAETTGSDAPAPQDTPAAETQATDTTAGPSGEITRPILTEIVLAKGREGKRPLLAVEFAKFKQADETTAVTGLPNLQPKDYAAFYELSKDL